MTTVLFYSGNISSFLVMHYTKIDFMLIHPEKILKCSHSGFYLDIFLFSVHFGSPQHADSY
jgi:hypothetical protein